LWRYWLDLYDLYGFQPISVPPFSPRICDAHTDTYGLQIMHNKNQHFQYFALDFNEENSGIHANFIIREAMYTNLALWKISSLYPPDQKIIILAHSMAIHAPLGVALDWRIHSSPSTSVCIHTSIL